MERLPLLGLHAVAFGVFFGSLPISVAPHAVLGFTFAALLTTLGVLQTAKKQYYDTCPTYK
jgi:hypothetical protein